METSDRKDLIRERTRDFILDAAARAFAKKGFDATTMKDLAGEAGYTPGAFYTYFSSKEELFDALLERGRRKLFASFDEATGGKDFGERLEAKLRSQFEFVEQRRSEVQVFFHQPPQGATKRPRGLDLYHVYFERWFAADATARDLGGCTSKVAACFLAGTMSAFLRCWLNGQFSETPAEMAALVTHLFLDGIRGGRGAGKR